MNNDNPYAAQFMASINNPQPVQAPQAGVGKKKIVVIAGIVALAAVLITIVIIGLIKLNATPRSVNTGVSIMLVPLNATAEINGEKITNGTYTVEPGQYTARLSADGFVEQDVAFEVKENELTTVAVYLLPNGGHYSDEDIDLLRFMSNDNETNSLIEMRLLEKGQDFKFNSYEKGLLKAEDVPLSDEYVGNSKKLIAEMVSAYFYFAHPEITAIKKIGQPTKEQTFSITVNSGQEYLVNFVAYKDETVTTGNVYNITSASLRKSGSDIDIFRYDGSFSYGPIVPPTTYDTDDISFD